MTAAREGIRARIAASVAEAGGPVPVSRAARVSESAVRSWCDGSSVPSADRLAALCRACGVSADWLLGLSTTEREEGRHEGA